MLWALSLGVSVAVFPLIYVGGETLDASLKGKIQNGGQKTQAGRMVGLLTPYETVQKSANTLECKEPKLCPIRKTEEEKQRLPELRPVSSAPTEGL